MKKLSIAAICAASLASVCIAAPTFAAEAATVSIENESLYNALKSSAHITTKKGEVVEYVDLGGSTPSGPSATAAIIYASPVISIEFDCTHGDPLEGITDFSDFDKFTDLESVVVCSDINYDFADSVDVYVTSKHAPQGELSISKKLAETFRSADYTYYNLGNTANPIGTHADSDVIVGTNSENVKTITFDCSDGDPLAMFASNELAGPFAMFPNAETIYVCSDEFASVAPEGVEIVNHAITTIPAGNYTMDKNDFEKNGLDAKLIDEDGNVTEYTYRDLQKFLLDISENPDFDASLHGAVNDNTATSINVVVKYKGEDYLTLTYEDSDSKAAEKAEKTDSTENPDTADDFTGIIAAVALSGVALGAGVFAAPRRR